MLCVEVDTLVEQVEALDGELSTAVNERTRFENENQLIVSFCLGSPLVSDEL